MRSALSLLACPCYDGRDAIKRPVLPRKDGQEIIPSVSSQPGRQIEVSVAPRYRRQVSDEWLREVTDCALQVALSPGQAVQVSLLLAGDTTVRELNREFRGLDEATDVLSFSPAHPGPWEGADQAPQDRYLKVEKMDALPFVLPPGQPPMLGDIVVSYPQARRQALARGEPVAKELARLFVHGVLHLAGYDHQQPAEAALMQAREEAALTLAFSSQPSADSPTPLGQAGTLIADR